jgi:transcriptional regulator with XRE-family HTH domain
MRVTVVASTRTRYLDGAALRRERRAAGLHQKTLGLRAGIARPVITRYENGGYSPNLDRVFALAEVIGCHPARLLPADVLDGADRRTVRKLAGAFGCEPADLPGILRAAA